MKIHGSCYFKDPIKDHLFIEQWVSKLERINNRRYNRFDVDTSLGNCVIWSPNSEHTSLPCLFIFPGFRTSSLFWDLDRGLELLEDCYRIFLVETNGQPTLSDGHTPEIKILDYGIWAGQVIKHFTREKVSIAGASFGGLICLKFAQRYPTKIHQVFLLNPGCLQPFSLSIKNLYYNLLPIINPSVKNVERFLNNAVFNAPAHSLSADRMQLIIDYEVFALTRHIDKAQKPYAMTTKELETIAVPVHLIVGSNDLLFPFQRTITAANKSLKNLKSVHTLSGAGHGIETLREAMSVIKEISKLAELD